MFRVGGLVSGFRSKGNRLWNVNLGRVLVELVVR